MDFATTVVATLIGSGIGAWVGAWVIIKRQEAKNIYPRKLLSDFLTTLSGYKTYDEAKNEFNKRSIVEKKAVIVALKNLGVPVRIDVVDDSFNVDDIQFDKKEVVNESIKTMLKFVKEGLCDDLFFKEIGADFYNVPPKIVLARSLALKFLDALSTQPATSTTGHIVNTASLDWNQYEVIQVFHHTVDFMENGEISKEKIKNAKNNVRNGIFDFQFYWDIRAFDNMNAQRNWANISVNRLTSAPAVPTNEVNQKATQATSSDTNLSSN